MPAFSTVGSPLLTASLFIAALLWISLALGRRILLALGATLEASLPERGVIAAALGASALQFVPFALGLAGQLTPRSLMIAFGVVALALSRDLWAVLVSGWRARWARPANWQLAWTAALAPPIAMAALSALTPTIDADGLAYHLTVPKRWMSVGTLAYLPAYPFSNAPMAMEMLFSLGLATGGDTAAKCIHLALGLLGAVGLYLAGRRVGGSMVGAFATTLFLVGPASVTHLLGFAYVEGATSLALIASSLAWLLWWKTRVRGWLHCAALLAGSAVCFKNLSAVFLAGLWTLTLLAMLAEARGTGARLGSVLARASGVLLLMLVPLVPWFTRALVMTGNPFFPLFAAWIPSRDLTPATAAEFERGMRYMNWANTGFIADWGMERRKLVLLVCAALVAIVGAIVAYRLRSWSARAWAVVLTAMVMIQIFAAGLYIRYWIPLLAVLALPVLGLLSGALSRRWVAGALVGVTVLASLLLVRKERLLLQEDLPVLVHTAAGLGDARTFLAKHLPLYPIYEEANRTLPATAGILLVAHCGAFYLDRTTYCAEFIQDSVRFSSWSELSEDVRRLGITHVIGPRGLATGEALSYLRIGGVEGGSFATHHERKIDLLRRLLSRHARLVIAASDQALFALDPTTTAEKL